MQFGDIILIVDILCFNMSDLVHKLIECVVVSKFSLKIKTTFIFQDCSFVGHCIDNKIQILLFKIKILK